MMPLKNKRVFRSGHNNSCMPGAGRKIAGFGLVEVMVALVLGLILLGTVYQSFVSTRVSYGITEGMSRLQENYRYAMAHMDQNFRSGGHAGCLEAVGDNLVNLLGIQTGLYNFNRPVFGTEGGANPDDITVIRAIGSAFTPVQGKIQSVESGNTGQDFRVNAAAGVQIGLQQYQVVTLSNCAKAMTFMITNDPSGGLIQHNLNIISPGPLNTGQFNQRVDTLGGEFGDGNEGPVGYASDLYLTQAITYSLQPGASGNLALFANGQELVEGVEDMQIQYGVAMPGGFTKFDDANNLSVADWDSVESVRITLTMNSVQQVTNQGNGLVTRTYTKTFRVRSRNPS